MRGEPKSAPAFSWGKKKKAKGKHIWLVYMKKSVFSIGWAVDTHIKESQAHFRIEEWKNEQLQFYISTNTTNYH